MAGETSGHTKICLKYKLAEDECIGFAVTKSAGHNYLTTNSRTLNTEKFRVEHDEVAHCPHPALKRLMLKNLGSTSKKSDGALSRDWANNIAATLEIAFTHCIKGPGGHFEAPF